MQEFESQEVGVSSEQWVLYFNSPLEMDRFMQALSKVWKEVYQVRGRAYHVQPCFYAVTVLTHERRNSLPLVVSLLEKPPSNVVPRTPCNKGFVKGDVTQVIWFKVCLKL